MAMSMNRTDKERLLIHHNIIINELNDSGEKMYKTIIARDITISNNPSAPDFQQTGIYHVLL